MNEYRFIASIKILVGADKLIEKYYSHDYFKCMEFLKGTIATFQMIKALSSDTEISYINIKEITASGEQITTFKEQDFLNK